MSSGRAVAAMTRAEKPRESIELQAYRKLEDTELGHLWQQTEAGHKWDHFTTRGHLGKVLSVASSTEIDYCVTGGEDCTMRVWSYDGARPGDESSTMAWHMTSRVEFDSPVTAVACSGLQGPAIGASQVGNVTFICLLGADDRPDASGKAVNIVSLHEGAVNEMCVVEDPWILATAGEDGKAMLLQLTKKDGHIDGDLPVKFTRTVLNHIVIEGAANSVFRVRSVSCEGSYNFVTCCADAVRIWTVEGALLITLPPSEAPSLERASDVLQTGLRFQYMDVSMDGTLLIAGGSDVTSAWALENGMVTGPAGASGPSALEDYMADDVLDVGIAPKDGHAVNLTGHLCILWRLRPHEEEQSDELVVPRGKNAIKNVMNNHTNSSYIRTVFDPDDGPALLVCGDDGAVRTWDMAGTDAGELTAVMRSLAPSEVLIPIFSLFITFMQVSSFAFGPKIPWAKEVHSPAAVTAKIANFELHMDKALIFWPKICFVLGLMASMVLWTGLSMHEVLRALMRCIMSTTNFKRETHADRVCGPMHLVFYTVKVIWSIFDTLLQFCSTVLVVPMFKAIAEAVDCVHDPPRKPFVATAPHVECFEGNHLKLAQVLGVIVPIYFLLLLPFAVVDGQAGYVQFNELFRPAAWKSNAQRKASLLYVGFMHPNVSHAFGVRLSTVIAKIMLPIIAVETTSEPRLQMSLISTVGFFMFISTFCWKPLHNESLNAVLKGSRLFTLCMMLCGLLTTFVGPKSLAPPVAVAVSAIGVIALTAWDVSRAKVNHLRALTVTRGSAPDLEEVVKQKQEDMDAEPPAEVKPQEVTVQGEPAA